MQRIMEQATQAFEAMQANAENYRKMGMAVPAHMDVTLEEVIAHFTACAELGAEHSVHIDAQRFWGRTRDEIEAYAVARSAKNRRSRGYKALRNKYGEEAAKNIIRRNRK